MELNEQIEALCERAISQAVFPGCSVAYVVGGRATELAFGRLTYEDGAPKVRADTIYDVASITKSVPTSSLMLKLVEDGRIGLDDRVIDYIPELQNEHREQVLVRHLLTYTITFGLDGGTAALSKKHPDTVIEELMSVPLVSAPGTTYWYANGPAILMGLMVERIYGRPLDEVARMQLFGPLGMKLSTFSPVEYGLENVAPTEMLPDGEVRGRVHDESAWAITKAGGHSGAAGLFTTSGDLLRFCQMLLGGGSLGDVKIFEPATVELMHTDQLRGLPDRAGLGWELLRPELRGSAARDQTFGKTGFTGCVMMIDPQKHSAFVHLSNRTYPKRTEGREPINAFRKELADLVFDQ